MCGKEINSVPVTPGCPVNIKDTFLMVKEDGTDFVKMTYEDLQACISGIPVPEAQIEISNGELKVSYLEENTNKTWLSLNPQVFLMRDKRKKKHYSKNPNGLSGVRESGQGVVHPVDGTNGVGKWAGWKWFSGVQFGHTVGGYGVGNARTFNRTTEWAFPATQKANEDVLIPFVKEMFWRDQNGADYFPISGSSFGNYLASNLLRPGGNLNNGNRLLKRRKTQKFYLVFVCTNPLATKTNGLCPVLFGHLSTPFYSTVWNYGGTVEIKMTKQPQHRLANRSLMIT
ncbi:MAG: hypothetical protein ACEQSR_03755 [Candidatus Methylacidiphilales bacterium]